MKREFPGKGTLIHDCHIRSCNDIYILGLSLIWARILSDSLMSYLLSCLPRNAFSYLSFGVRYYSETYCWNTSKDVEIDTVKYMTHLK